VVQLEVEIDIGLFTNHRRTPIIDAANLDITYAFHSYHPASLMIYLRRISIRLKQRYGIKWLYIKERFQIGILSPELLSLCYAFDGIDKLILGG